MTGSLTLSDTKRRVEIPPSAEYLLPILRDLYPVDELRTLVRNKQYDDALAYEAKLSLIDELQEEIEAQKDEDAAALKR
jgi:hypothetical protein